MRERELVKKSHVIIHFSSPTPPPSLEAPTPGKLYLMEVSAVVAN